MDIFLIKTIKKIEQFPINDGLHDAIFEQGDKRFRSYQYLRKLIDYYKGSDFKSNEVQRLAQDIERYKSLFKSLSSRNQFSYNEIKESFSGES
jgi:hypothetical protein